jgi:arsenate reductase
MPIIIYHNPKCSKSRQTLELLKENGITPTIIEYLKTPPTAETLKVILAQLGMAPRDLIERPIVLANNKAALGRPPEQVLDIL